jgi:hypothetical protein
MKSRFVLVLSAAFLASGCAQTYWAFPPAHTLTNFKNDEAQCLAYEPLNFNECLATKGYRQISYDQYVEIQKQALENASRPMALVAYDVASREIFIGKSQPTPGSKRAAVEINSVTTNKSCTGYAELTKLVPTGKGSIGRVELICRDGRKIVGDFVFDTTRSGFGRGTDTFKRAYLFKFGDLNLNETELRKAFTDLKRKEDIGKREKGI